MLHPCLQCVLGIAFAHAALELCDQAIGSRGSACCTQRLTPKGFEKKEFVSIMEHAM
jgi:hypothetical protein